MRDPVLVVAKDIEIYYIYDITVNAVKKLTSVSRKCGIP